MPRFACRLLLLALSGLAPCVAQAADLLVADRLSNSVFRYSESGDLLGTVLTDNTHLNQPSGMALSPDRSKLYVSSFQNARVMRYDYNPVTGTASNATIFAEGFAQGIAAPGGIVLSEDGGTIYVANLGGTGVTRLNADGTSAGASLMFGPPQNQSLLQFSGLAWTDEGELLVAAFQDFPAGTSGAIARWEVGNPNLELLVGPSTSLNGVSSLLVDGDNLYASGLFASNIQRFDLTTAMADSGFLVEGLPFPQPLVMAPDGNGLLVGVLGFEDGEGDIVRYDLEGNMLEFFISPGNGGFEEPTALVVVPDVLAGDFNGDGTVDAADYLVWRNTAGSTTDLRADADGDGTVDGDDYLAWKSQYTSLHGASLHGAPGGLSATPRAIPEPATAIVLAAAGLLAWRLKPPR